MPAKLAFRFRHGLLNNGEFRVSSFSMDISKHPLISDLQVPSVNQEVPLANNQAKDTAVSLPEQMTSNVF